jgi:hypothetical protein
MPFELYVRFTGLCAYILKSEERDYDNNAVRVIMPSVETGMGSVMEPHVPAILFDKKYLDQDATRRPYEEFISSQTREARAFCRLDGQDLTIGGKADKLYPDLTPRKGTCPTDKDRKSLLWLAHIPEILLESGSGYGDVDPCVFDPSNVPASVAARIRLTEGKLSTSKFFSLNGQPVLFAAGHCKQAFAEELTLFWKFPDNVLSIQTTSFRVESTYQPLVFLPKGNRVEIQIVQLPEDDLKEARAPRAFKTGNPRKADRHFEMFYPLSASGVPQGAPIPFPLDLCKRLARSGGPVAGSPQCPGSRFNAHPTA